MIRTAPHLLNTFVANCVADIQDCVSPSHWRHLSLKCNPADCASWGISFGGMGVLGFVSILIVGQGLLLLQNLNSYSRSRSKP
ncbi:hypothetical protein PR048_002062 [Dryococelus australis]|uniref:Uncharacterized protein n=1 Tax=Dryococelus australis TaxID=614101 RepID=A0ABQ9IJ47_9NEOP|nr:hypothetical protein PR048_002062 [Dryococelus australis]